MTVDAVLFDLDGTLCEYRRPGDEVLALAFDAVGVEPFFSVADYYERYGEFAPAAEGPTELRELAFEAIATERGRPAALGRALANAYAERRDHAAVDPLPGVPGVVRDLAAKRRVGLVTNGGPEMQWDKLRTLGLEEAFDVILFAGHHNEEWGHLPAKPDAEPFRVACDALGVAPERTVHVGNAPEADVAGAAAAGLTSVLVGGREPVDGAEPDHTVGAVADLLALDGLP
ncbi:MAG: HAD family hydrolase [Haloferacaceae archaeon]